MSTAAPGGPPSDNASADKEFGVLGFIPGQPTNLPDPDAERISSYPHLVVREFLAFGIMLAGLLVFSFFFDAPLEELANPGKTPNPAKAPWYFLSLQEMLHYAPPFISGVFIPTLLVVTMCTLPYWKGRMILLPVMFLLASILLPLLDGVLWGFEHAVAPGFADATRSYGFPTLVLLLISAFGLAKVVLLPYFDDPARVELFRKRLFWIFVAIVFVLVIIGKLFRGPEWRWVWPWQ
jgi:quinol-cytochrome oxidoreductase complex cytochrome b subunit